jgi:hypothetical protein
VDLGVSPHPGREAPPLAGLLGSVRLAPADWLVVAVAIAGPVMLLEAIKSARTPR